MTNKREIVTILHGGEKFPFGTVVTKVLHAPPGTGGIKFGGIPIGIPSHFKSFLGRVTLTRSLAYH